MLFLIFPYYSTMLQWTQMRQESFKKTLTKVQWQTSFEYSIGLSVLQEIRLVRTHLNLILLLTTQPSIMVGVAVITEKLPKAK